MLLASPSRQELEGRFTPLLQGLNTTAQKLARVAEESWALSEEAEYLLFEAAQLLEEITALRALYSFYEDDEKSKS